MKLPNGNTKYQSSISSTSASTGKGYRSIPSGGAKHSGSYPSAPNAGSRGSTYGRMSTVDYKASKPSTVSPGMTRAYGSSNYNTRAMGSASHPQKNRKKLPVGLILLTIFLAVISALVILGVFTPKNRLPENSGSPTPTPEYVNAVAAFTPPPTSYQAKAAVTSAPTHTPYRVNAVTTSTPTVAATKAAKKTTNTEPNSEYFYLYPSSLRWYYNQLSQREKELFSALYDGFAAHSTEITFPNKSYSDTEFYRVFWTIYFDCPELIWLEYSSGMSYTYNGNTTYTSYKPLPAEEEKQTLQSMQKKIMSIPGISGKSMFDRELAIYRYIASNTIYSKAFTYCYNADSVFAYGKAKCAGFCRAFCLACRLVNIPCFCVYGVGGGDGHEWNLVQIDGNWYCSDVTWDCPTSDSRGDTAPAEPQFLCWLNLTSAEFSSSHQIDSTMSSQYGFTFPTCTATTASCWNMVYGSGANVGTNWKNVLLMQRDEVKRGSRDSILMHFTSEAEYKQAKSGLRNALGDWSKQNNESTAYHYRWSDDQRVLCVYDFGK